MNKNTIGYRIFELRKNKKMSRRKLAEFLGVHETTIKRYEDGDTKKIPIDNLEKIAKYLDTSMEYLMGCKDNISKQSQNTKTSTYIPISVVENIFNFEEISSLCLNQGELFALKIKDNSMEPRMKIDDIIIVRRQSDADSGDSVIVSINGNIATCKKLEKTDDGIILISTNLNYPPMFYSKKDIKYKPVVIIGKVIELRHRF